MSTTTSRLDCAGPCGRIGISLTFYSDQGKRVFRETGRCILCGNGSYFVESHATSQHHDEDQRANQTGAEQIPLRKQLNKGGWKRRHEALYKAVTATHRPKKVVYAIQKNKNGYGDGGGGDGSDGSCDGGGGSDVEFDAAPVEAFDFGGGEVAEPTSDEVFEENANVLAKPDDDDDNDDEVPKLKKRKTHRELEQERHEQTMRDMGLGICGFCGAQCNVHSQACGMCRSKVMCKFDFNDKEDDEPAATDDQLTLCNDNPETDAQHDLTLP